MIGFGLGIKPNKLNNSYRSESKVFLLLLLLLLIDTSLLCVCLSMTLLHSQYCKPIFDVTNTFSPYKHIAQISANSMHCYHIAISRTIFMMNAITDVYGDCLQWTNTRNRWDGKDSHGTIKDVIHNGGSGAHTVYEENLDHNKRGGDSEGNEENEWMNEWDEYWERVGRWMNKRKRIKDMPACRGC